MKHRGLTISERDRAGSLPWLIVASVSALAIWWLRFDYSWGLGDQDEFLPYLLHLIDPDVLATDWFVQTQRHAVSVRTPFVFLLRVLSFGIEPQYAILTVFVFAWIAIGWSVFRLAEILGNNSLGAFATVIVAMSLTPKWTLGGNDLVYTMLVPEMAAWGLGLPGIIAVFRQRWLVAGILMGLAGWLQLLVGLLLVLLVFLAGMPNLFRDHENWRRQYLVAVGAGLLVVSPLLSIVGLQQMTPAGSADVDPLWILTQYRAPYHYLPSAFSYQSYLKFFLLILGGGGAIAWLRRRSGCSFDIQLATRILLSVGLCLITATVFSELIPVAAVVKLQLFKTTVVAKLLLVSFICAAMGSLISPRVGVSLRRNSALVALTAAVFLLSVSVVRSETILNNGGQDSVERWAKASTSRTERFMIPPSISSFRSRAQRSIIVNYAAVPFAPKDLVEWYRRMQDVAPLNGPATGIALKTQLDSAFHQTDADRLLRLAADYDVRYLVRRDGANPLAGLPVAFQDSAWVVYIIRSDLLH